MNKILSKYEIQIFGLDQKQYEYEFEGDDNFFLAFEQDIITNGQFKATVILEKTSTMMLLKFHIKGKTNLICDRSLEPFDEPFDIQEKYIYKFGSQAEVLSDEIEIIPVGSTEINIAQHLFDFISLVVPFKKIHPSLRNEEEEEDDEYRLIYADEVDEEEIDEEEDIALDEDNIDPRWEALKKLRGNN